MSSGYTYIDEQRVAKRRVFSKLSCIMDPSQSESWRSNEALFSTVKNGNLERTKFLLDEAGLDPFALGAFSQNALIVACSCGHLQIVKYLIEEKELPLNDADSVFGLTPLMCAAIKGCLQITQYLIEEKRVDTSTTDKNGMSVVHLVSKVGALEVLKYFGERNMDMKSLDSNGVTPLLHAVAETNLDVVVYLIDEIHCDPLQGMANNTGFTAIHVACSFGYIPIIKYLIEKGCDPLKKYSADQSSLHEACKRKQIGSVKYLIEEKKIDPRKAENDFGFHPIFNAVNAGDVELVKYFIDNDYFTPGECSQQNSRQLVLLAVKSGCVELLQYLIEEKNYSPSEVSFDDKFSPLHGAIKWNKLEIAKYLLTRDAVDLFAKDNDNRSALSYASNSVQKELLDFVKTMDPTNDASGASPTDDTSPIGLKQDDRPTMPQLIRFETVNGPIINIINNIGADYEQLGILLLNDTTGTKIRALIEQYNRNSGTITTHILREWLQGRGATPVSWKTLVEMLEAVNLFTLSHQISVRLQE